MKTLKTCFHYFSHVFTVFQQFSRERADFWTDGPTDGHPSGKRTVGRTCGRAPTRTDWRIVGRTDWRMVGRRDGRTDGRADGQAVGRTSGRSDGRAVGWTQTRSGGRTDCRSGGRTSGPTGERTVGRTCGQADAGGLADGRKVGRSRTVPTRTHGQRREPTIVGSILQNSGGPPAYRKPLKWWKHACGHRTYCQQNGPIERHTLVLLFLNIF